MADGHANGKEIAKIAPPRLPYDARIEERFGIDAAGWRTLTDAIFPSASTTDAIVLALAYCRARKLDPFKKPVQIVPMWDAKRKALVDTVWPGIGELRTTAFRTGQYAGRDAAIYGEEVEMKLDGVTVIAPQWCEVVVYRIIAGVRVPFHGPRVHWMETYATKGRDTKAPNSMWARRPHGQLEKCAEAAALRAAFPEEIGNEYAAEEMEGRVIDHEAVGTPETVGVPKQINSYQAKKSNIWPKIEEQIRGFDDLGALEEWWASGETQTLIGTLSAKWQECAQEEYEKRVEALADEVHADLERERRERGDITASVSGGNG